MHTHLLDCLKRRLKRMHVHGSHPFLLKVVLILPLVRTHPKIVTCQTSLGEWKICQCHTEIVAWAVVPAGQLGNVGVVLLYALYKLTYANPLGLFEHVGKVAFFLLSHIVQKHSEKVDHDTVVEWLANKSPWAFLGHALKILERISLHLLLDNLVPCILGIRRQQICVKLKHLGSSGFCACFWRPLQQTWLSCSQPDTLHAVLGLVHQPKQCLPWPFEKPCQKISWKISWKFSQSFLTLAHGGI